MVLIFFLIACSKINYGQCSKIEAVNRGGDHTGLADVGMWIFLLEFPTASMRFGKVPNSEFLHSAIFPVSPFLGFFYWKKYFEN